MDLKAKPTPIGYALAAVGAVAGLTLGSYLRPKVEACIHAHRVAKAHRTAMMNPTVVDNVPGSPIDEALKKRGL